MISDANGYPGFTGRERLVAAIDAAMGAADVGGTVARIEHALREAIADPAIVLPACVHEPITDHYARRELYRSARHGYSIIGMTWGPGQGTPLHDHDGLWCVEGVWQGALRITPYRLREDRGDIARLQPLPGVDGTRGSAGNLIPPDEFHVLRNASDTELAISVHVYQRPMEHCTVFVPEAGQADWYRRESRQMQTDTP
ncbi:cysteine dioxygenase family protein [Stenotrophomonas acidaminiphila]|uniref:cysteine dioxygenase family protein n=1 Tax=Stenotrophomonas acidaminiphila TaxID=128780 RepID=UPI0028ABB322|nr:cysteine dioxygenase family protein [Stenotrophomonas acidaminiphila]